MHAKMNEAQLHTRDRHMLAHRRVLDVENVPYDARRALHNEIRMWFEAGFKWLATPPDAAQKMEVK